MNEFEALLFSVHRLLLMSTIAGMYMCEVTTTRQLLTKVLIFKEIKRRSYHYRTHRSNSYLPCILSITIEHGEILIKTFNVGKGGTQSMHKSVVPLSGNFSNHWY